MNALIPVMFVVAVVVAYCRFRGNFSDLASATDSKRSDGFWNITAILFSIAIVILYFLFRTHWLWKSY